MTFAASESINDYTGSKRREAEPRRLARIALLADAIGLEGRLARPSRNMSSTLLKSETLLFECARVRKNHHSQRHSPSPRKAKAKRPRPKRSNASWYHAGMAPSRFGSIRELPSGNFQARYRPRNGEYRKATFETYNEAEEWLEALAREQKREQ